MTLTDISGLLVGHATDEANHTGCTAVLCPEGAAAGVEVRGFAPGTRETDLLSPLARVDMVHGILLTGGSAFGLAAATGVVRWLKENGYGLETLFAKVPLVPAAVIFDLNFNQSLGQPDEAMGYQAASQASRRPVAQGCVGAGAGATCGKLAGFHRAMKSGLGSASLALGKLKVAALAVVNPLGSVLDPETAEVIAGLRTPDGAGLEDRAGILRALTDLIVPASESNTVLAVVATDAALTKLQAGRVAKMASAGLSRVIRPAHLMYDGDVVFALATGQGPAADENVVGALAAEVLARAVAAGAREATSLPGFPAHRDLIKAGP
ncbi:MAG: P1 family peptidase [Thermodesulfobacteriota bacterium]